MRTIVSLLGLLALACGGGSGHQRAVTSRTQGGPLPGPTSQPEGSLRVGHYSTPDGLDGFVLDRGHVPPLFRRDGTDDVLELEARPGPVHTTELVNADAHIWIRVGRWGEVLYDGPDQINGVRVFRDANAVSLR